MLLTMSTPAPALVITTPTEVGGAPSMVSEAARDRGAVSVARRREGALYAKLRPGPHSFAPESVASNQRARLYGAMVELVAARGYEASTVAELCALAGSPSGRCTSASRAASSSASWRPTTSSCAAPRRISSARRSVGSTSSRAPARWSGCAPWWRRSRARWPHTPTPRGSCWWRPPGVGPAALAHTERTRRLVERAISWSLRAGSDTPAPSPLTVKRIVADGTRLVRARLRDGRTAELTGELSDLCVAALRDRNRFLHPDRAGD